MVANTIEVPPPGFFIREELESRGWSQVELAYMLEVPVQAVSMILSGKRGITPEMAKKMGVAFDVPPEFFLNLQIAWELYKAPDPHPDVAKKVRLQSLYPVRDMMRRQWLVSSDGGGLEAELARFFDVDSAEKIPHMAHAAFKSRYDEIPPPQLAWLFRVRQIAKEMIVEGRYSPSKGREAVRKLSGLLSAPEETRHVPRILSEAGIRYVLVESLPSGKIDGVCCWLGESEPVIGMSLRFDRIDNFWFVLRHELEHMLRNHGRDAAMIDADLEKTIGESGLPEEEVVANEAASNFCVPRKQMDSFIARKAPFFSERSIVGFAARLNLHPGLVAGQLRFHLRRWDLFAKHLAKVRSAVAPSATADGWGDVAPVSGSGRRLV
jgi:HTH-type transcriptional regulator/antitoxin HigA